jgi:hypothetical protein
MPIVFTLLMVSLFSAAYIIIYFGLVGSFNSQYVQHQSSIKRLVANLTIQVQLIKAELIFVLHKLGDLGLQLLATAHRIHRHVKQAFRQGV